MKKRHKQTAPALKFSKGFVLLELLVVISVIGFISTSIMAAGSEARESARVARTVQDIRQMQKSIALYISDTGQPPVANCVLNACNASNDPMFNSFGVQGWNGPYLPGFYKTAHAWGGQITYYRTDQSGGSDWDSDGSADFGLKLNDDRPGQPNSDNKGRIPTRSLVKIDVIIDDGNLATGKARGNGNDFSVQMECVAGELCIIVPF